MPAKPVDLATYRASKKPPKRPVKAARVPTNRSTGPQVPIVLTAHPEAISMVVPEQINWLSPAKARSLGNDLIRLAAIVSKGKSRG